MDPVESIPHKPPILCVDRLVEADPQFGVSESTPLHEWEPWLIEGLAQTAALLNACIYRDLGIGMLVQVRKFAITRAPRPKEKLTLRVDIIRRLPPLTLMDCRATAADGEVLARGELKFYLESGQ